MLERALQTLKDLGAFVLISGTILAVYFAIWFGATAILHKARFGVWFSRQPKPNDDPKRPWG